MAEPLARTTVEIDADLQKLNAKLSEVEQKLNKTGTEGARAGKKMEGGINRAAKSAERLQSIVTKLLIPAAVFAAVTRLVRLFSDLATRQSGPATRWRTPSRARKGGDGFPPPWIY
jgi:phage-related minor tail protein